MDPSNPSNKGMVPCSKEKQDYIDISTTFLRIHSRVQFNQSHAHIARALHMSISNVYAHYPIASGGGRWPTVNRDEVRHRRFMNQKHADIAKDMKISLSTVYIICPVTPKKRKLKELLPKRKRNRKSLQKKKRKLVQSSKLM